jgi:hypothetical protein
MARYHATVESRRSATETFGYLATFSNAAEWNPGALAGEQLDPGPADAGSPLQALDPVLRPGFRAVAERAAAGLAQALSGRPRGPGTTTSPGTPVPSGGAARPGDAP